MKPPQTPNNQLHSTIEQLIPNGKHKKYDTKLKTKRNTFTEPNPPLLMFLRDEAQCEHAMRLKTTTIIECSKLSGRTVMTLIALFIFKNHQPNVAGSRKKNTNPCFCESAKLFVGWYGEKIG